MTGSCVLTNQRTIVPCISRVIIRVIRAPWRSANTPQKIRPATDEIPRRDRTQAEANADSPAVRANPTTCTSGTE